MDSRISAAARPDIVMIESTPRPTPAPERVSFSQVLSAGANGVVQGAELVANALPGSPVTAAAVRGGGSVSAPNAASALTLSPEGPASIASASTTISGGLATGGAMTGTTSVGPADPSSSIDASLQQSAQMNLYYLQVQEEVDSQNRSFTALSNVIKTEHDSAKAAIQNIHS
ncbi:MAG TPA: hypothetical protein VK841_12875 [Polyangiaceae bacterium]|jgi:hypothetical protein|nr:hypothetical protein [Polyangiaceae bacterium]